MNFEGLGKDQPFSDFLVSPGAIRPEDMPDITGGRHMSHDQMHKAPLTTVMGQVTARFDVPEDTVRVYLFDQSEIMGIPMINQTTSASEHLEAGKKGALIHLVMDAQAIEAGDFLDFGDLGRTDRRKAGRAAKGSPDALEQNLRSEANRPWVQDIFDRKAIGLHRSNALGISTMSFYLSYGAEIAAHDPDRVGAIDLNEESAVRLFGEGTQAGERPINEVSDALRSAGKVDLSKEALDDRVTAFWSLATVEMVGLALRDLRDFGRLGSRRAARATQIYRKHKDTLFNGDVGGPTNLLLDLADAAQAASDGTPQRQRTTKALLAAMAEQSARTAGHVDQLVGMFRSIYDQLGYPYHGALLTSEERVAREAEEDVVAAGEALGAAAGEVPEDLEEAALTVGSLVDAVPGEKQERLSYDHLDVIILPDDREGLTSEDFQERLRKIAKELADEATGDGVAEEAVIWQRLFDLAEIATYYGARMFRSKPGELGANRKEPYFVTFFSLGSNRYGVADSPMHSHGTYVVAEQYANYSPLNVLKMRRKDARANGAISIPHTTKDPHGPVHQQKVHNMIAAFEDDNPPQRHPSML